MHSPEPAPVPAKRAAAQSETQFALETPGAKGPELPKATAETKLPTPSHQITRLAPRPGLSKPAVKAAAPVTKSRIATYRDWMIVTGEADGQKTCSLMTLPRGAARDLAASDAPHVRVPHALSSGYFKAPRIVLGKTAKPGSRIVVVIDKKRYRFNLTKGTSELTVRNRSWQFLRDMLAGIRMKVRFIARDGAPRSADYSLLGFTRAYRRTKKDCRGAPSQAGRG